MGPGEVTSSSPSLTVLTRKVEQYSTLPVELLLGESGLLHVNY